MSKRPTLSAGSEPQIPPSRKSISVTPLFSLGRVVATPGALQVFEQHGTSAFDLLRRHQRGDWCDPGELGAEDLLLNQQASESGGRIFSVYRVSGVRLYVITEATNDAGVRESTCVLLPSEY